MAHKIYGQNVTIIVTADTPPLISFTIADTTYQAEEGMTWQQWVESSYNTDGYSASDYVFDSVGHKVQYDSKLELPSNIIVDKRAYVLSAHISG